RPRIREWLSARVSVTRSSKEPVESRRRCSGDYPKSEQHAFSAPRRLDIRRSAWPFSIVLFDVIVLLKVLEARCCRNAGLAAELHSPHSAMPGPGYGIGTPSCASGNCHCDDILDGAGNLRNLRVRQGQPRRDIETASVKALCHRQA